MLWARILNGTVQEIINTDPTGYYHPSIVWVKCTSTVKIGYNYDGSKFSAPATVSVPSMQSSAITANGLAPVYPNDAAAIADGRPVGFVYSQTSFGLTQVQPPKTAS